MLFRNKVIIVTGGSGGIGRSVATFFAEEGAKVIVVARNAVEIKKTVREIGNRGGKIFGIKTDVSKKRDVKKTVSQVLKKFKTVDVLVNCAGVQKPIGPFAETKLEEWKKNVEINLLGTVTFCHEVLPVMMKRKKGKIINFSGGGATSSRPNFSAYAVAKTGVVRFTEILAEEVRHYNIQVNAVAPGAVNTRMLAEVLKAGRRAGSKEFDEATERQKKGGTPPELAAKLVLFLASPKSDGLTGRLISAVWDSWQKWNRKDIKEILNSEKFTLRRIK